MQGVKLIKLEKNETMNDNDMSSLFPHACVPHLVAGHRHRTWRDVWIFRGRSPLPVTSGIDQCELNVMKRIDDHDRPVRRILEDT